MIEKPVPQDAPSNLVALGSYIFVQKLFDLLENLKPGVGGEIQLTDVLSELLRLEGLNVLKTDADIYDCGNKLGYFSVNLAIGMRDPNTKKIIRALFKKYIEDDLEY